VKPYEIFKADFLQHLQDFNNILVNKFLKPLYLKVLSNSGAIYVPNSTFVFTKLKQVWSRIPVEGLLDYMKNHYEFEGKPVSEMKLNAPIQIELPNTSRPPHNYGERFSYRPRGNYNNHRGHHSSSDRRHFQGERRPYGH
jgi:hypothetical protein